MKIMNCPFCGSDDVSCLGGCLGGETMAWVACYNCNAEGPTAATREGAVHRWNERIKVDDNEDRD